MFVFRLRPRSVGAGAAWNGWRGRSVIDVDTWLLVPRSVAQATNRDTMAERDTERLACAAYKVHGHGCAENTNITNPHYRKEALNELAYA